MSPPYSPASNRLPALSKARSLGYANPEAKALRTPPSVYSSMLPLFQPATNRLPALLKARPPDGFTPVAKVLWIPPGVTSPMLPKTSATNRFCACVLEDTKTTAPTNIALTKRTIAGISVITRSTPLVKCNTRYAPHPRMTRIHPVDAHHTSRRRRAVRVGKRSHKLGDTWLIRL